MVFCEHFPTYYHIFFFFFFFSVRYQLNIELSLIYKSLLYLYKLQYFNQAQASG